MKIISKTTTLCILVAVMAVMVGVKFLPRAFDVHPAVASSSASMNAVVYRQHGDVHVLKYEENFPRPIPRTNHVLVKVEASAINPVDYKLRRNWMIPKLLVPLPKVPGADLAGTIVQVPSSQNCKFKIGDRVAALMPIVGTQWGALADYVAIDERFVAKLGDNTSFETAAAVPLAALTAWQSLRKIKEPQGKKLLVHAGAGGVGSFAIQLAKDWGMYVATTASAPKSRLLKDLGADLVIDYTTQQFEDFVTDYDAVFDPMSWLYEERVLSSKVLKPTGVYINLPSSDAAFDGKEKANGIQTYLRLVTYNILNFFKPGFVPDYRQVNVSPSGDDLQQILGLVESGNLRVITDRVYQLSEAVDAFRFLETGHATGKVVLYHGN